MGMTDKNLCDSCTNIGCMFQSGIVRTKCAFYMPPQLEPDNCGNYVVQDSTTKNNLGVAETNMIDKSNFSQEQYKADLQSAYDCGKSVIDKIRTEIVELTKCPYGTECLGANCPSNTDCMLCSDHVLEIIDKYKAETEDKE